MNTQIIELSAINAKQKISNAEWTTNLQRTITLQPNDQITILQSIIDANLAGDFQNINIEQDTNITIEFGFYYVNDSIDLNYGLNIDTAVKLGLYVARDSDYNLITNKKTFTITAGNYNASTLAQLLSAQISQIPQYESIDVFNSLGGGIIEPMINYFEVGGDSFESSEFGFDSITASSPLTPQQLAAYTVGTDIIVYYRNNDSTVQKHEVKVFSVANNIITFEPVIEFLFDKNTIYDLYCILKTGQSIKLYNHQPSKDVTDDWIEAKSIPRFMGTNEFAIEYNINNNGKFQFTQFHMSPYTSDTDNEQSINAIQYNESGSLFFLDVRTGIFFTQLEPANFWFDTLGFNSNIIVIDNKTNIALQTPLLRGINITSNYIGADALIASTRTNGKIPITPYDYKTNLTNAIIATNTYISQDIGYSLIELRAIPSDYNSENKGLSSGILQICSNAYDNNGFTTSYNESSLTFINTSNQPIIYGSFNVRILNPKDYTPIKTLGPRTTIFLQIIKAINNIP